MNRPGCTIELPFTPPYNQESMLAFLARRATPGVETVTDGNYTRSIRLGRNSGYIRIHADPASTAMKARIVFAEPAGLPEIRRRIDSLFDLSTDPAPILVTLEQDSALWSRARLNPGLRKPGCWDGFEIAVRAIVGQQISIKGATTIMGRITEACGDPAPQEYPVPRFFPAPAQLARLDPHALPMPKARAATLITLARSVDEGKLELRPQADSAKLTEQLCAIKGIGRWTAQYIAMRALGDADALLEGDLVLEKAAGHFYGKGNRMTTRELLQHAEKWRPFRAYASLHLWEYAGILNRN